MSIEVSKQKEYSWISFKTNEYPYLDSYKQKFQELKNLSMSDEELLEVNEQVRHQLKKLEDYHIVGWTNILNPKDES